MKSVSIHDAKTNLSKYIAAAKRGEKIYIGSFGKSEVVLAKVAEPKNAGGKRSFTIAKGKVMAKPSAFSDATEQQIAGLMLDE